MKGNAYDRYITTSVTNENVLKMIEKAAQLFIEKPHYNIFGEQCDTEAWRILHAGGVYYGKAATPRLTLVLAAKDLKLTIYDIG